MTGLINFLLRLRKRYYDFMYRFIYPDIPFEIMHTDQTGGSYTYPEGVRILAEFDCKFKHFIIIQKLVR